MMMISVLEASISRASGQLRDPSTGLTPGATGEDYKLPCEKLARFFHGRAMSDKVDVDDLYIFTWTADLTLGKHRQDEHLLSQMADVAQQAMRYSYTNCGYWDDLPWFNDFIDVTIGKDRVRDGPPFDAYPSLFELCTPSPEPFRRLVRVLYRSHKRGLLTGQIIWKLPYLRRLAAIPLDALESCEATEAWIKGVPPPNIDDLLPGASLMIPGATSGSANDSSDSDSLESWVPSLTDVAPSNPGPTLRDASTAEAGDSNAARPAPEEGEAEKSDVEAHRPVPLECLPRGPHPSSSRNPSAALQSCSGSEFTLDRYGFAHNPRAGRAPRKVIFTESPAGRPEAILAQRKFTMERRTWYCFLS